ncbi:Universal stress protein [Stieleria bergensis]|uniref:Universal stress protein n=1 Tax=Stieleria bergensis TaxID=2528025 RepID=A0A517SZ20_9BACT|nr:Universal stress protein [Planctomycetes bacterium SV_7m_r]
MKKIMLATDGSEPSLQAARFLAHLPHDETIELTIVSALFVPGTHKTYLVGDWIETCLARERESADQAYAEIAALFEGADVNLRHVVREGSPAETIVAIAKGEQPELIVLGATGHSSVARMLLGSTSDYVATHAPCSVLVARPTDALTQRKQLRVAIGYEESGPAEAAMEEFAEFDWTGQTDVRVVSVTYEPGFYDVPYEGPSKDFVEEAAGRLHQVAPNATGHLVHFDHIGEGLVHYLEGNDVDLVVVGETPRSRLSRVLMGSMTRYVLRHAPCSVWITRNRMIQGVKKSTQKTETATT